MALKVRPICLRSDCASAGHKSTAPGACTFDELIANDGDQRCDMLEDKAIRARLLRPLTQERQAPIDS